ncbi:MAG: PAS domain-containing sensor histidine kinase [Bacteroidia bacterium]|nr:PAS domain-containing sensor histidine kinase [Bacteroidia bacterium]
MKLPSTENLKALYPAFDVSTDLIAVIPLVGPADYINPAGRRLLGVGEDDEVFFSNHRPDWATKILKEIIFPEAQTRGSWAGENYYLDSAGNEITVYQTIIFIGNSRGERNTILTTARRLEHNWKKKEKFSRNDFISRHFFYKSTQPIYVFDYETRMIREANPAFLELLGYTHEELDHLNIYDIVSQAPDLIEKNIENAQQYNINDHIRAGWKKKSGEIVPVEVSLTRLQLDQDVIVVIGSDISDQIQAEESIRASEEKYRTLVQHLSEGLLYLDLEGNILFANDRFCEMTGYSFEELHLKNAWAVLLADSENRVSLGNNHGESFSRDIRLRRGDGEFFMARIGKSPLADPEGNLNGSICLFSDITNQKETERQLTYKKRELDTFIYRASHDLKAPLNSLQGLVKVAGLEVKDQVAREYFGLIEKVANKLNNSLVGLLELTLLNEGLPSLQPLKIRDLVEDIFIAHSGEARLHSIELVNNLPPDLVFHSDEKLLRVILNHLFQNSLRFFRADEDHRYLEVRGAMQEKKQILTVIDNGQGIEKSAQPKVFDMFYKTGQLGAGSGLGLYIAKNAVEKLGGSISLTSTQDSGTEFRIELKGET